MVQKPSTAEDFYQIAVIHKQNLAHLDFFLSKCSVSFIKLFYEFMNKLESTILLVDKTDEGIVKGFALSTGEKNRYLKRFFKENINKIIFYTSAYMPILKAVLRRVRSTANIDYPQELLYMAVDPAFRGNGVLTGIVSEVEKELAKNSKECYLQVHGQNKSAHSVYQKLGFKEVHKYYIGDVEKIVMKKNLYAFILNWLLIF